MECQDGTWIGHAQSKHLRRCKIFLASLKPIFSFSQSLAYSVPQFLNAKTRALGSKHNSTFSPQLSPKRKQRSPGLWGSASDPLTPIAGIAYSCRTHGHFGGGAVEGPHISWAVFRAGKVVKGQGQSRRVSEPEPGAHCPRTMGESAKGPAGMATFLKEKSQNERLRAKFISWYLRPSAQISLGIRNSFQGPGCDPARGVGEEWGDDG